MAEKDVTIIVIPDTKPISDILTFNSFEMIENNGGNRPTTICSKAAKQTKTQIV
jgi:hypothetical protein